MNDIFNEIMVKKEITVKRRMLDVLIVLTGLNLAFLSLRYLDIFAVVPVVAVIYFVPFLVKMRTVEFEYVLTNDQLDIDQITAKSRRKHLFTLDVRQIELLAPMIEDFKDEFYKGEFKKTIDCGTHPRAPGRWFIVFHDDREGRVRLIFEPNGKMVKNIALFSPRKVVGLAYLEEAQKAGDML